MAAATNTISVSLSKAQVYFALVAHSVVILSASLGLMIALGRVLIRQEFQKELVIFHEHAVPEIERLIDQKITEREQYDSRELAAFREAVLERLKGLETVDKEREERLRRMEVKIDMLLERR